MEELIEIVRLASCVDMDAGMEHDQALMEDVVERAQAWTAAHPIAESVAPFLWHDPRRTMPPQDEQVLVMITGMVGPVCDVACFVGRQPDGSLRWILADVRLDQSRIIRWSRIRTPELKDE